jgi:hypothetical protein
MITPLHYTVTKKVVSVFVRFFSCAASLSETVTKNKAADPSAEAYA